MAHQTRRQTSTYPQILSTAVHPGVITDTGLYKPTLESGLGFISKLLLPVFQKIGGVSSEEGSYSTLKASLDPKLTLEKDNGKYYVTLGVEQEPTEVARNEEYANEWWGWACGELEKRGFKLTI
ncbi:unnamed protein product [Ambrosiozyma monospora]|uniref:Unnamed protein product n=1 Tax=Ambrosiozyma monospora TaxID=43982 RepID=A0A9W6TB95_AMBMO|nr:unnamed protein product [Ambrosiozyma monospora]